MKYKVNTLDVNIYASNKEMGQAAAKAIADDLCDLLSKKSEINILPIAYHNELKVMARKVLPKSSVNALNASIKFLSVKFLLQVPSVSSETHWSYSTALPLVAS